MLKIVGGDIVSLVKFSTGSLSIHAKSPILLRRLSMKEHTVDNSA